MKKLITSILLSLTASISWANTQVVQIVWPFAPGSTQATMIRHLIDSANQQQNKYQFVFFNRPGAGGAIAANYASSASSLTVLASTSSFYSRPLMYNESHDPEQFRLTNTICLRGPLALFSKKYQSFNDMKNREVTVGINPGSVTQLFTQLLAQNNSSLKFREVPYKNTPDATTDMLGQHIDSSVDLLSIGNLARLSGSASVIGITGIRSFPGMPTMASLKVKGLENLTNSYFIFLPKSVDVSVARELNQLFNNAINDAVRESCNGEHGQVELTSFENTEKVHQSNQNQWRQLTQGIVKQ